MMLKLERKRPSRGEEVEVMVSEVPERFREFLMANECKRITVLFKPVKSGRLAKVTVNHINPTCGCCSPSVCFTR